MKTLPILDTFGISPVPRQPRPASSRPVGGGPRSAIPRAMEAIRAEGVTIRVRHELGEAQIRLLEALNVTVVVDPHAQRCAGTCKSCKLLH